MSWVVMNACMPNQAPMAFLFRSAVWALSPPNAITAFTGPSHDTWGPWRPYHSVCYGFMPEDLYAFSRQEGLQFTICFPDEPFRLGHASTRSPSLLHREEGQLALFRSTYVSSKFQPVQGRANSPHLPFSKRLRRSGVLGEKYPAVRSGSTVAHDVFWCGSRIFVWEHSVWRRCFWWARPCNADIPSSY